MPFTADIKFKSFIIHNKEADKNKSCVIDRYVTGENKWKDFYFAIKK